MLSRAMQSEPMTRREQRHEDSKRLQEAMSQVRLGVIITGEIPSHILHNRMQRRIFESLCVASAKMQIHKHFRKAVEERLNAEEDEDGATGENPERLQVSPAEDGGEGGLASNGAGQPDAGSEISGGAGASGQGAITDADEAGGSDVLGERSAGEES